MSETIVPSPMPQEVPADDAMRQLASRLDYLESQNEGLKRVGVLGLLLVLLLGGIVVHQSWADLGGISTRGLTLNDSNRELKAAFTISGDHVALLPTNVMGTLPPLQDTAGLDFRGLGIYDSQGHVRVLLGVNSKDDPMVAVLDTDGRAIWTPAGPQSKAKTSKAAAAAKPHIGAPPLAGAPPAAGSRPAASTPGPGAMSPGPEEVPPTPTASPNP